MVSGPQSQLHPHHQPLPAEYQTTDKGRAAAQEAYSSPTTTTSTMASPPLSLTSTTTLPNSLPMPLLGFGIYRSPPSVCVASCLHALKTGYRHIDSAQFYANEAEMGAAVRQSGIPRSDIFLTTKILSAGGSPSKTLAKLRDSVAKIDPGPQGYVDLFLIHSPSGGKEARREMWQALEQLLDEGRAKSIGVSNFGVGAIEELREFARVWPPHVNQIELHPFCQQRTIVSYCQQHNITIQAYSPLVRNQKAHDPTLTSLAQKHGGKTVSQILIRYALQKGWVPLPKSDTPSRIEENADVYGGWELGEGDMAVLDGLDEGEGGAIVQAVRN
ncbi:MAG: hypothetical protein Q9195_001187 [Heterodermia aff. obscurata]